MKMQKGRAVVSQGYSKVDPRDLAALRDSPLDGVQGSPVTVVVKKPLPVAFALLLRGRRLRVGGWCFPILRASRGKLVIERLDPTVGELHGSGNEAGLLRHVEQKQGARHALN